MARPVMILTAGWMAIAAAASGRLLAANPQQPSQSAQSAPQTASSPHRAVLNKYCVTCHNEKLKIAGLLLDKADVSNVPAGAEVWEKVIRKLRTGAMPPGGAPRPDQATYDSLASYLETEIDRASAKTPNPGLRPALHRLNRAEYQNAIRDLLALDALPKEMDIASLLPVDDSGYGFDNIADVLGVSPTLLERYVTVAQKISRVAIGDPAMPLIVDTYKVPAELPQDDRFDGFPVGTRGGIRIRRQFPLDGEYQFRVALAGGDRFPEAHQLELSVDGERLHLFTVGGNAPASGDPRARRQQPQQPPPQPPPQQLQQMYAQAEAPLQIRVPVKAGPRVVIVTFIKKSSAEAEDLLEPFTRSPRGLGALQPALASVTISGPYDARAGAETPSRRRIFACHPSGRADEAVCAKQILTTLARRAYRRPANDVDLQVLMPFYNAGRADGSFETGIQRALDRVLVSPAFLFRIERDAANIPAGAAARASDIELASRMSFFLWSSIPDDELLDAAVRGKLKDPTVLAEQVRRLLADRRSEAVVTNFAGQWLLLRSVAAITPDPRLFPDFDEGLRQAMRRETELFFDSIMREDHSVLDLLNANYTFVNERLAKHYGIDNVYGDYFRRITLTDENRRGLLGQGSILTVTSYATRTSPVLRGKWILENVLAAPPPPPPPNVPALKETNNKTGKALSMREAMTQHRANPVCAACHGRMDPLGFALENFDAVGRWRTQSGSTAIDASGNLPDGTKFEGAAGLRQALLRHPDQFVTALTERLLTYALGRGLEYYDGPAIRAIVREAARSDYRFSSLVGGIIKSVPFQMRKSSSPPPAGVTASRP